MRARRVERVDGVALILEDGEQHPSRGGATVSAGEVAVMPLTPVESRVTRVHPPLASASR